MFEKSFFCELQVIYLVKCKKKKMTKSFHLMFFGAERETSCQ